jgi:hypothetical protein
LNVTPPVLVALAVTPANPSVLQYSNQQFAATGVYTNGSLQDITPSVRQDNVAVSVDTTIGSNIVTIHDVGSNVTSLDTVYVPAHIAVGGLIIYGLYRCSAISANTFQIAVTDLFGNPYLATSTVATGGAVATYTTTIDSAVVTVFLTAHAFQPGDVYAILIPTTVSNIALAGEYVVQSVPDLNHFTIQARPQALAGATVAINGGQARYEFYIGKGPLPLGSGYGVGGFGIGGYGSGAHPTASSGAPARTGSAMRFPSPRR